VVSQQRLAHRVLQIQAKVAVVELAEALHLPVAAREDPVS
jgi:hypothetical protein